MIPAMRNWFNQNFTDDKYISYLNDLSSRYPNTLEFRVAETPIFIDKVFTQKMMDACESIIDVIVAPNFIELTNEAVPGELKIKTEKKYSDFIAFDFGICTNENGELEPQLIEMQGFPSLFAFQIWQDEAARKHFSIPDTYSAYLNNFDKGTYTKLLSEIIAGGTNLEETILLEIFPEKQKTRVDFAATKEYVGINTVCLTSLIKEGNHLFYIMDDKKIQIKRIYNRLIFDDLYQQTEEVQKKGEVLFNDVDVEWIPYPEWFYRISKYTLPFINHPYVPTTYFLNKLQTIPSDLENYVLKPLFSFAGQGVIIDVKPENITSIANPENWILQKKVKYADIVKTPDIPAKAEIRLFYFWKNGELRPIATTNLARLSKGKMIGVRYNSDKEWVGGTLAYFEK